MIKRIVPAIGTNGPLARDTAYPRCDYKSTRRLQL